MMATEKRLIDANALIAYFDNQYNAAMDDLDPVSGYVMAALRCCIDYFKTIPTVDAVEVVHGRWIMDKLEIGNPYDGNSTMIADIGNCSCCGYRCEMLPIMNYCPNCGAKMDGGNKDGR